MNEKEIREIFKTKKRITRPQQRALHLLFRMLGITLNNAGLDQRKVLKPSYSIPWTEKDVKEHLWRQMQIAVIQEESTKYIDSKDINLVMNVLMTNLGEKFGVFIKFPNKDTRDFEALVKDYKENPEKYKEFDDIR